MFIINEVMIEQQEMKTATGKQQAVNVKKWVCWEKKRQKKLGIFTNERTPPIGENTWAGKNGPGNLAVQAKPQNWRIVPPWLSIWFAFYIKTTCRIVFEVFGQQAQKLRLFRIPCSPCCLLPSFIAPILAVFYIFDSQKSPYSVLYFLTPFFFLRATWAVFGY